MKVISIRQPWAWLIVRPDLTGRARREAAHKHELKDVENRSWRTHYRGPLLIHAAKGMTRIEYEVAQDTLRVGGPIIELPPFGEMQRGGIVGRADLIDCIPPERRASWWHFDGDFGFLLADVKPLPFRQCKGALGIFDIKLADHFANVRWMVEIEHERGVMSKKQQKQNTMEPA